MRALALVVLGACSFSPGSLPSDAGGSADDDGDVTPIDGALVDAFVTTPDGSPDAQLPGKVRSIDIADAMVSGGPHVDFPLLVSLANQTWLRSTANGGDVARTDGFDIYFSADQLGVTRYSFEVEAYNPTTGTLAAWVKVPLAAATVLYMHYGDPADTTNLATPALVWTAGYELVGHYNGTGDAVNKNTLVGTNLVSAVGRIGNGQSFDGTTSTSNAGSNAAVDDIFTGGGVVEAWYFADTYGGGGFGRLFDKGQWALFVDNSNPMATNALTFAHTTSTGNGTAYWHWNNIATPTAAWHHVALVYNKDSSANTPTAYIDGVAATVLNADAASGTMTSDADSTLYIGERLEADRGFDGILDELRFSSTVQSAGWYQTQFRNHSSPSTFYTVSAPL